MKENSTDNSQGNVPTTITNMSSDELLNLPHSQITMCHLKPSPLCLPPSLSLLTPCPSNPHLVEQTHHLFIQKKKKQMS